MNADMSSSFRRGNPALGGEDVINMKKNIVLTAVIIAVFYGSTLGNGFVHDDFWQVRDNPAIRDLGFLPKLFTGCIAESILGGCKNIGFYYRPLQAVFYAFTYQISGQPWAFHLANLVYLFLLSLLLLKFFRLFLPEKFLPLLATLFVIAHPVNSEVVNWVSAAPELLLAIFVVGMFLAFVRYRKTGKNIFLITSVLAFLLALFTKETALFLFLLLPLYTFLFSKAKTLRILPVYFLPMLVYLSARSLVLGKIVYHYEGWYGLGFWPQVANALALYPRYLGKLIYPLPLNLQHPFNPVGMGDPQAFAGLILLVLTAVVLILAYKRKQKTLLIGLSFILLPLAPALLFINKLGEFVFSERYLFISTIGFGLVVFELARIVLAKTTRAKLVRSVLFLTLIIYLGISGLIIWDRNKDWKDQVASYKSILATFKARSGLTFDYPKDWRIEEKEDTVFLFAPADDFQIQIAKNICPAGLTSEDYLAGQKNSFGQLLEQGPAKIPNTDSAYVRVWNSGSKSQLEFFLFKADAVIRVLVGPADSPQMKVFDAIVASLKS